MFGWNPSLCRGKINAANLRRQNRIFIDDYAKRYDISTALSTEEIISKIFSNGKEWIPILDKHVWEGDEDKVVLTGVRLSPDCNHEALLASPRPDPKPSRHSPLPGQFPDPPVDTYTPSPEPEPVPHGAGWTGSEPTSAYSEGESPRPRMSFVYPPPPKPLGRDAKGRERGFADPSPNWLEEMLLDYEGIRRDMSNDMDELVLVAQKASLEVVGLMADIKEERKDLHTLLNAISQVCGKDFLDKLIADAKATADARRASGNAGRPDVAQSSQSQPGEIRVPVDSKNKAILGKNPLLRLSRQQNSTSHQSTSLATTSGRASQNGAMTTLDHSVGLSTQIAAKPLLFAPSGQVPQNGATTAVTRPSEAREQLPQREGISSVAPGSVHASQKPSPADGAKARKSLPATESGESGTRRRVASEGASNTRRTSARLSSSQVGKPVEKPLKRSLEDVDEEADGEDSNNKSRPTSPKKARRNADQHSPKGSNEDGKDDGNDGGDAPKRDGGGGAVRVVQQQASSKRSIEEIEEDQQPNSQTAKPDSPSSNQRTRRTILENGASSDASAVIQPARQEPAAPAPPRRPRPLTRQYNVFFSIEDPAAPKARKKTPPPPPSPLPQGAKTPVLTPEPSPGPSRRRNSTPPPAQDEGHPEYIGMFLPPSPDDSGSDGADYAMTDDGNEDEATKERKRYSAKKAIMMSHHLFVDVGDPQGRKAVYRLPRKDIPEPGLYSKSRNSSSGSSQPVASGSGLQNANTAGSSSGATAPDSALRTVWFDPPTPVPRRRPVTRQTERIMQDPLTGRLIAVDRNHENRVRAVAEAAREAETRDNLNGMRRAIDESHSIEVIHDESQFLDEEDEEVELPELLDRNGKPLV
ncbi:hypothetical protein WG66_002132 [Moniliophthora roreri]|uniref:Uncharacterized protein n=1 Tax=Moniliophthora roreri TaxID=221103 RepID=A0A0W0FCW3_MONRR|nr:hypothetical protein WG66_002132 [Moniliophthora roreri]